MRRRRPAPAPILVAHANIGLLLLFGFFVTNNFRSHEAGVQERLLPWFEETVTQSYPTSQRLLIQIDENDQIRCEQKNTSIELLEDRLESWYMLYGYSPDYHVTLDYSEHCTFASYLSVKDAILNAHRSLRRREAENSFGKHYDALASEQRRIIMAKLPLRLSETTRIWSAEGETEPCAVLIYPN